MDISEQISQMAEKYDPERDEEAQQIRALLQGAMFAGALLDRPHAPLTSLVRIAEVQQLKDEHGDYLPYYTIITESGHRIRVTVEVES